MAKVICAEPGSQMTTGGYSEPLLPTQVLPPAQPRPTISAERVREIAKKHRVLSGDGWEQKALEDSCFAVLREAGVTVEGKS